MPLPDYGKELDSESYGEQIAYLSISQLQDQYLKFHRSRFANFGVHTATCKQLSRLHILQPYYKPFRECNKENALEYSRVLDKEIRGNAKYKTFVSFINSREVDEISIHYISAIFVVFFLISLVIPTGT
jgi:hypothetical protein